MRNKPGRMSSFSWLQIWEPDGTSTVQGPLTYVSGWSLYAYPVGFDITSDGSTLVYGFSNSRFSGTFQAEFGTYVRPATTSVLPPIKLSGQEWPTTFGTRVIASTGSTVNVQQAAATTYGTAFTGWLDTSGTGLELNRSDVSANGTHVAFEVESSEPTPLVGKIAILKVQSVDAPPTIPAAVDCFIPATGRARDVSLSQDATRVAWTDTDGLKVAGVPTTAADPCVMTTPATRIAAAGRHASIGGADIARFLPATTTPPPTTTGPVASKPALPKPKQVVITASAAKIGKLSASGVLPVTVTAPQAKVKLTVQLVVKAAAARKLGITVPRRAKTVVIGTGVIASTTAGKKVVVKVKLTRAARASIARAVKRKAVPASTAASVKLTFTQGKLTSTLTRAVTLRR